MKIEITPYDTAEFLDSEELIALFLDEAFETNDPAYIAHALGVVARARGMTEIAQKAGLSRESLYKALSGTGNPGFGTILNVMKALDIALTPTPRRLAKTKKAPARSKTTAKKKPAGKKRA